MRRFGVYLACTFGLTISAWGTLVFLQPTLSYGMPEFMVLYAVGGLGPTIAAYVAVLATSPYASVREFHHSVFQLHTPVRWHIVTVSLPIALVLTSAGIAMALHPGSLRPLLAKPWYSFIAYFFGMVAGGGLEEIGWRGVAQPELEKRFQLPTAALIVGSLWSVWHLPLFALPGVSQYGMNFPAFAAAILGDAMILAWLRSSTGSISHCIMFHASSNAAWMLVFGGQSNRIHAAALSSAAVHIIVGTFLVTMGQRGVAKTRLTQTAGSR